MKKFILFLCSMMVLLVQVGCIEVRDENEDPETVSPQAPVVPKMVPPAEDEHKLERVVIDGEMFVVQGQIMSRKELDYSLYKSGSSTLPRKTEDFEFHIKEMVFNEGAILYTLGHRVRLHVDRLIAAQGRIHTFPAGTKAPLNVPGRSGGHLFLNVGKAEEGRLYIEMRGENGGDGLAGPAPDASLKGTDGRNSIQARCSGGKIPKNQVGGDGGPGKKGYPGGDGASGGSSGTLEIKIQSGDLFAYQFYKYPGVGGRGGAGGRGGEGGKPGRTSRADPFGPYCVPEVYPVRGAEGEAGATGAQGKTGNSDPACVTRDGKATCF